MTTGMELIDILIWVGKKQWPAKGHKRGDDIVMVPTDSGPLYFRRPQWCEANLPRNQAKRGKR